MRPDNAVYMPTFQLPDEVKQLVVARNLVRDRYKKSKLKFTFDGNLVGDIGEALAHENFGLKLVHIGKTGIDAEAPDGRTVQIKATGTARGPTFRDIKEHADALLFFDLDYENLIARLIYNGPERPIRDELGFGWKKQKMFSRPKIEIMNRDVADQDRLPILTHPQPQPPSISPA